jgi:hypothetical protein
MRTAAWVPGWYELDQPIMVGLENEFIFWDVVPEDLKGPEPLVFYNDLRSKNVVYATGRIRAIRHPELGEILQIDARGLDYTVTLADGTKLAVNAEEEPGKIYMGSPGQWVESDRVLLAWRFAVEFESLSDLSTESRNRRRNK